MTLRTGLLALSLLLASTPALAQSVIELVPFNKTIMCSETKTTFPDLRANLTHIGYAKSMRDNVMVVLVNIWMDNEGAILVTETTQEGYTCFVSSGEDFTFVPNVKRPQ